MKKLVLILLSLFFSFVAFTQEEDRVGGGKFLKRIEYNYLLKTIQEVLPGERSRGLCVLDGKNNVERLLLGDFNALSEFFYEPSFEGAAAFRVVVVKDSLNNLFYVLEVNRISNYDETWKELQKKYPLIGIPAEIFPYTPKDISDVVRTHNREMSRKKHIECIDLYKIETLSFPIGDKFAKKLHKKMSALIDNFKGTGIPNIIGDGYTATFRCVVEDEAWSLNIHMPQVETLKFSNFCRQIIDDANAGNFDEAKYVDLLND